MSSTEDLKLTAEPLEDHETTERWTRGKRGTSRIPSLEEDDGSSSLPTETVQLRRDRTPQEVLTVLTGADAGRVFPLVAETSWIGRSAECELRLGDTEVSRKHAAVLRRGKSIIVRDNNAKNGTFVNGRRVREREVQPGDEIQLGEVVSLVFTNARDGTERLAQQRSAREKAIIERMCMERIESLSNLVTRVAHEVNTPIGIAHTANAMISSLVEQLRSPKGDVDALLNDLKESTELMGRGLGRLRDVVRKFKQLSSLQLSDEHEECDLGVAINDWLEVVHAQSDAQRVIIRKNWSTQPFPWSGFPGHTAQAMNNLLQNVFEHAYPSATVGTVDLRLSAQGPDFYSLEIEDYGAGISDEIRAHIFEPFITSNRDGGSTGLGLAIVHNIVVNRLGGEISFASTVGRGTKFTIRLPRVIARG